MSQITSTEMAFVTALAYNTPNNTLAPGPSPVPISTKAALKRCCSAWRRTFNAYDDDNDTSLSDVWAAKEAGKAYCNAMPLLTGYEGIRDFIACAAHGILIGAIPPEKSGQLIYAAQVALSILQFDRRPANSPSK